MRYPNGLYTHRVCFKGVAWIFVAPGSNSEDPRATDIYATAGKHTRWVYKPFVYLTAVLDRVPCEQD